ncbi:MAG: lipid-A-disaccharide synthase [Gallionellaceae bacterium]|nr:MAG: lipid-A-disaccharide synthase [Gallionellaceae bacterium]
MSQTVKTIALVAGETSGDLLGSHLIVALKQSLPDARFIGIGGPKMQAAGMEVQFPMEKLSVFGYIDALRHLREILGIRNKLRESLIANPPDVFIGIDAPDFNLGLELALKQRGIPTIHYVSPSIWAWRGERINKIKSAVSHILTLFPFEAAIYEQAGVPVTYVGHPLADMLPEHPKRELMREQMRIQKQTKVFALLPGSRQSEVRYLAGTYIQTAKLILQKIPTAQFLVPLASRETRTIFEDTLWKLEAQELPITMLFGHAHDAMIAADGVLVASGTATLEAALLKRPMVITYKMLPLTYALSKRKAYLPYVGLPNVLAGKFVVPEILQDDATPENLAQALLNLVGDKNAVAELEILFGHMYAQLKQDTAHKAAQTILPYLTDLTAPA